MKKFPFVLLNGIFLFSAAHAQTTDRDSFEVGIEAYNAGNCKEAVRILKKFEKEQPSAAYVIKACTVSSKKRKQPSYDIFLRDLNKGDLSKFEKLGMLARFNEEISGLFGAQYLNALQASVKRNDTDAFFRTGLLYQEGIGLPRDFSLAIKHFEAAARNGHTEAMNSAALYYRFGIGIKQDKTKAKEYWQNAILKNNAYALFNLGEMLFDDGDFLTARILADLAVKRINPDKEKKYNTRAKILLKRAKKGTSLFHTAYLEKFRPFWLKPVLKKEDMNGARAIEQLPLPPKDMIEETPFMRFISKDDFDNRYKTFFPLMPDWVPFDPESPKDPEIEGKSLPAPAPEEKNVIEALYFRPSDPRYVNLTLVSAESAIPLMAGDILTLFVYTPLHETPASVKGGHLYIQNTAYKILVKDPNGIIGGNASVTLTPLSEETARQEAWMSRKFTVQKEGTAVISFVPQPDESGKTAFAHSIKIVAGKGKPPK